MASIKAEKAIRLITEEHRSVSRAMREAGYSPHTASKPSNLTKSKSWAELMEKYLPEKKLTKKHAEFLNAPRRIRTYKKGDLVEETEETDPSAVKALDMAYKLKGKYQSSTQNNVLVINVSGQTAERYQAQVIEPVIEKPDDITTHDVV